MKKISIKLLVIVTALAALVVSALAIALTPRSKLQNIDTTGQPMEGNPTAKVHFIVFEDLKCPNCRIYNMTLYPLIKKKYIDTGIANYTFITLAFIPGSIPAGNAALCLNDQDKEYFFPFINYLYEHQPSETEDWATIPTLLKFARAALPKANLDKLSNCIFTDTHTDTLKNNLTLAGTIMKPVATPALYINGKRVSSFAIEKIDTMLKAATQQH